MSYNIFNAVRDAINGNLLTAEDETIIARRAICDGCEVRNELLDICTACGCFIPAKIRLSKSSCPMELWSEEDESS